MTSGGWHGPDIGQQRAERVFTVAANGKVPSALGPDGLELKFNPWHDPADGRFTFAGAGRREGSSEAHAPSARNDRAPSARNRDTSRTSTPPKAEVPRAQPLAGDDRKSVERRSAKAQSTRIPGLRPDDQLNPVAEFVGGVG